MVFAIAFMYGFNIILVVMLVFALRELAGGDRVPEWTAAGQVEDASADVTVLPQPASVHPELVTQELRTAL
jgi:hypothetical protein